MDDEDGDSVDYAAEGGDKGENDCAPFAEIVSEGGCDLRSVWGIAICGGESRLSICDWVKDGRVDGMLTGG